jgi:hypothetical protein
MELSLGNQPTPYKRINARKGASDACVAGKNNSQTCIKVSGVSEMLVGIIENENTTGLSLVLKDDFILSDPHVARLEAALSWVPQDWDLIRFDCWDWEMGQVGLDRINRYVWDTSQYWETDYCRKNHCCWFCGGCHAMLWRGSRVHKLKKMWSIRPYEAADCIIAHSGKSVRSYCVNIGIGDLYYLFDKEK